MLTKTYTKNYCLPVKTQEAIEKEYKEIKYHQMQVLSLGAFLGQLIEMGWQEYNKDNKNADI